MTMIEHRRGSLAGFIWFRS